MARIPDNLLIFRGISDIPAFQDVKCGVIANALCDAFSATLTPGHVLEDDKEDPEYPDFVYQDPAARRKKPRKPGSGRKPGTTFPGGYKKGCG
jgi:hypothetical protein